ncbi:hypothetical protein [Acidimangrovimonas sediminis]|uniref:hypothetical protein n=1 Tax=Acidimangrovimonas sediminis TaxID=2056283 RepID=UPI000C80B1B0|nr:hypothetical protein [Acidimangrovimonas sediminis]
MRQALFLGLALCFGAFSAIAETIPIRSGEHGDFSRIVLPLEQPAEGWTFGRLDDGYQLRLGRGGVHFDLRQVFEKIPKTRLTAISADDAKGWLTLRLACACYAEVFPFRETRLVIDIRRGPPPSNSPFEKPLETAAPKPKPDPSQTTPSGPAFVWRGLDGPFLPPPAPPDVEMPTPENLAITRAREALLRQLARAGTQGLIKVDPRRLTPTPRDEAPAHPGKAHPDPAPEHVSPTPENANPLGVQSRTVMDRDAPETPDPGLAAEGAHCPPDTSVDIASWVGEGAPADQIGAARRALVGEFDAPSSNGAEALARLYLGFGLGAEARAVLTAFPDTAGRDRPVLLAMTAIFDQDHPELARALSGFGACPGKVALWSMLASPPPGPGDPVDANAVRRTFSGLPLAMRRELGPRLSQIFLARGDKDTALALRDAITRAAGDGGDGLRLTDARIDMADGDPTGAEHQITPVILGDGPDAPDAMVLLVDTRIARGEPVDGHTIEALAALAHERRGTPEGNRLIRAEALALGTTGQFAAAFAMMGDDPEGAPRLWQLLAEHGSEEALLQAAITPPDLPLDAETRRRIADRLIGLGFGAAARAWITTDQSGDEADRLRLGRAALASGDSAAALSALDGLADPAAALLRARALAAEGDHEAATRAYQQIGAVDLAGSQAWRAGDTAIVKSAGSEAQKKALSLPDPSSAVADPALGPLARDRARVDASRNARETLTKLLAETPSTLTETTPNAPATH